MSGAVRDSPAARFARDGWARLSRFVDDGELEALRLETERALSRPLPPGCERPHNTLVPLRWGDEAVELVVAERRRLARVRAAVRASDLRWISAYVSVKAPRSGPLWWHQDWWCWDHPVTYAEPAPQVAVLCYLSATTVSTGALRVLPGSHRASVPLHGELPEAHTSPADGLDDEHPAMADHPGQVSLEVAAGDAVVLDYRILHGTHPNRGERRRDSLLLSFAPDWARLPADVRAHLVRHPAQPSDRRGARRLDRELLPSFDGTPRDLPLNRLAPAEFVTAAAS